MQAYVLRAQMTSWLAPFAQAGLPPSTNRPQHRCETRNEPAGQANIERLRETDLRDRRRNGIAGNGAHRPAAGSQGGFAHWSQSSSHGRATHRDLRGQLASRIRALVLAEGQFPQRGRTPDFASQLDAQGQQGTKKAPLRRTAPFPHNYGRKPDPP